MNQPANFSAVRRAAIVIGVLSLVFVTAAWAQEPAPVIYQVGQLDRAPKAVKQDQPSYPVGIAKAQIDGMVDVAFVVDATGHVVGARARKCLVMAGTASIEFGAELRGVDSKSRRSAENEPDYALLRVAAGKLARSAVDAVNEWRYQPGMKSGREVNSVMAVVIPFRGPKHTGNVSIQVTGLDLPTKSHHITSITNEQFAFAVGTGLTGTGTFATIAETPVEATYHLEIEARIFNTGDSLGRSMASVGGAGAHLSLRDAGPDLPTGAEVKPTFSTTMEAHCRLIRAADQKVLWETDITKTAITTRGTAMGAALLYSGGRQEVAGGGL